MINVILILLSLKMTKDKCVNMGYSTYFYVCVIVIFQQFLTVQSLEKASLYRGMRDMEMNSTVQLKIF